MSRSSTSTAITAATGSPKAPRRSRFAEWPSGCSSSAASDGHQRPGSVSAQADRRAQDGSRRQHHDRKPACIHRWRQQNHVGIRRRHRRSAPFADPAHRPTRRRARRYGTRGPRRRPPPPRPAHRSPTSWSPTIRLPHWAIRFSSATRSKARPSSGASSVSSTVPMGKWARAALLRQCAQALAAIHRADANDPGLTHEDQLVEWRERLDAMGDTTATFEWGFRWLAARKPDPSPTVLVHGDFRMGNLIVDGSDLAAVLDWELVHVGHAYEDLAWFCIRAWRFGAPASLGAGGLGSIESFLLAYEAGQRDYRRSSGVSLVAGAGHAALGCHLPAPGRAALERAGPLGGVGGNRAPRLRDRVGSARPARGKGRSHDVR